MPDENTEQLFAQLDDIKLDEYTVRVLAQATEIEELLSSHIEADELTQITVNDICQEAIAKMDAECPYLNDTVLVTGRLKQAYYDEFTEKFGIEYVEVDRQQLTSYGYAVFEFYTGETGKPIRKVGHLFLVRKLEPKSDAAVLVDYAPRLFAFAPVGQVNIEYDQHEQDYSI